MVTCRSLRLAAEVPATPRPAFDQQPIEVAALADACARAATVDSDPMLATTASRPRRRGSTGDNDAAQPMWDPDTGGGFDGLQADGVNRNQGAESTLAVLSTLQHAQRFSQCRNDFGAVSTRHARARTARGRPLTGHQPAVRPRAGGLRASGLPRGRGAERASSHWTRTRSARRWTTSSTRFDGRHRDLIGTFRRHARELADRLDPARELSDARLLLLGATFTSEYAIEGAALCNPSMVAHPDQTGALVGSLRFVMSVRAIGEGHCSSIGFRTGVDRRGRRRRRSMRPVRSPPRATLAPAPLDAAAFRSELARLHDAGEDADYVLDSLGGRFTETSSRNSWTGCRANRATRGHARETIFADPGHRRADIRRRIRRRHPAVRAGSVARDGRGGRRYGGRALRPVHR